MNEYYLISNLLDCFLRYFFNFMNHNADIIKELLDIEEKDFIEVVIDRNISAIKTQMS